MNKRSKRFLSVLIATAFLFSTFVGINLPIAFADVQNIQVTPYPREAGKTAAYRIQANINAPLNAGTDSITVILPKETRVDSKISSANISVNPRRLNGADFEIDYARGIINLLAPLQKGDRVVASYRYDPGMATTNLPRNVKFYDRTFGDDDLRTGNGQLDPGEFVYEDRNNNNRVYTGDRRLTNVIIEGQFYPAGSIVGTGDADRDNPLTSYPVSNLKFVDISNTGSYQPEQGDWLVDDRDNDGLLSSGDRIIIGQFWYMAGTTVGRHDLDRYLDEASLADTFYSDLIESDGFYPPAVTHPNSDSIYHTENISANNRYDQGEFIYKKTTDVTPLENRVQTDDTRLTAVMIDGTFYPRGSEVKSGDKDLNMNLVPFLLGDEQDPSEIFPVYTGRSYMDEYFPNLYYTRLFGSETTDIIYERAQRLNHVHRALYQAGTTTNPFDRDHTETLFRFANNERYIDNGSEEFYLNAPVYRDLDGNGRVSEGDIRLTAFSVYTSDGHHIYYTAGSIVRKGEADYGQVLRSMPEDIRYADERGTGRFDPGDRIYDVNGDRVRLTPFGIVSANLTLPENYPDAGLTLTRGWTEIANETVISYADGGETRLELNHRPIIRPVVAPINDPNHRISTINVQGGGMRGEGKFWYTITAVDSRGGESAPWAERMVDFVSGTQVNAAHIQWSPVENASKYRIYRTTNQSNYEQMSLVAEVSAPITEYIDLGGDALQGMPPSVYTSSFTRLDLTRTDPVTGATTTRQLVEFELSDYKLEPVSGTITFRQPLQQLDTVVADYDRAVKVTNENVVFQPIQGRGQLRHGNVLDPNIYGDALYPLRLHRISASNPDDPTLLVRGVDYEFEDENNDKLKGLEKGEIKFYIQLKDTDIVRAEYSYRRKVRGDMVRVATGNETTVRTSEGNIIAHTDRVMKGRTLPTAPVINVLSSEKGPMITFTTPVNITPNPAYKQNVTPDSPRDLNITFSLQIGIRNPEQAGTYQIFMRTSKEQTEALSNPYEIIAGEEGQQLIKLTRDQQVEAGSSIALTTSVQDELGNSVPNVNVIYSMIRSPEGQARLDRNNFITDSSGKTVAMLTTSPEPGENVVEARIAGTNSVVTFNITGLSSSPIQSIRVEPESVTLNPRETRQFRARGLDAQGNLVPNIDFQWSVSPSNLGTIDQNGNFTASEAIGSGMIYAEAYGLRGSAAVSVGAPPADDIAKITIEPTSATVSVNQTRQFTAVARNQQDQVIPGVSFNWSLTPADLGTISENGLFTALRTGTGVVVASAQGKQAIAAVTVVENIHRVEINPPSATVERNRTLQFNAVVYDAGGSVIEAPVSWTTEGNIGIITQTGLFTATQVGTGQVIATAGNIRATANVVVTEGDPGDTDGPDIQITHPTPNMTVSDDSIVVRGTVRDPSGVRWVRVNDIQATYDSASGNFTSQPVRLQSGENTITVTAEDTLGNQSSKSVTVNRTSPVIIKLAIGSNFAGIIRDGDTEMMRLDVAPFLQAGRTLVPLRFIAEGFGSDVEWQEDPPRSGQGNITITLQRADGTRIVIKMRTQVRTVIIETYAPGSVQPVTNRIEMEVAPFIVRPQGRTVVPIRFIAEGFGADVEWEPTTQEITITMTP